MLFIRLLYFIYLIGSLFFLTTHSTLAAPDIGAYQYASAPVPTLTINGRQDEILLYPGQPFTANIELNAGDMHDQVADWWLVAVIGDTFFSYDLNAQTWQVGLHPAKQAPLSSFDTMSVATGTLTPGIYDVYFGVDTQADGQLSNSLRYTHVQMNIVESGQRILSVSIQGDDNNSGTLQQPWKTFSHAVSQSQPGDIIWVREGSYKQQLAPLNSGAENKPIIFAAYPGETVILNGKGVDLEKNVAQVTPFDGLIHLNAVNYVWIVGFQIKNSAEMGIMVYDSDNIVIQDNYTYGTASSGIAVWKSQNIIVDGNEVEKANVSLPQENMSIGEDVKNFEIRYNHIHHGTNTNNGGEGLDIKDGSSFGHIHHNHIHDIPTKLCLYIDAWDTLTQELYIHHNRLHDCDPHGLAITAERGGELKNIHVYNNLIYKNGMIGIHLGAGFQPDTDGIYIYNNSFYDNGTQGDFGASIVLKNRKAKNVSVFNNLCASRFAQISKLTDIQNLTVSNNLFIQEQDKWNGEINGDNFVIGDPLFVDPKAGDFRLQTGSPARSAGSDKLVPTNDFTNVFQLE